MERADVVAQSQRAIVRRRLLASILRHRHDRVQLWVELLDGREVRVHHLHRADHSIADEPRKLGGGAVCQPGRHWGSIMRLTPRRERSRRER